MKYLSFLLIFTTCIISNAQKSTTPHLQLGDITNQDTVHFKRVQDVDRLIFYNSDSTQNQYYKIIHGTLIVSGLDGAGKIKGDGVLGEQAQTLLKRSRGQRVAIEVSYLDDKNIKRTAYLRFRVKN